MKATKMVVPIPDHVRRQRRIDNIHWYVICGGEWNNANVYVEVMPVGADIVLVRNDEVVRWMYPSRQDAHRALGRWTGEGDPLGLEMPDYIYTGVTG